MSYLDWKVGDRVVCVDDANWRYGTCGQCPVKGGVYTIKAVTSIFPEIAVQLVEFPREAAAGEWYAARRFRKVQPRKTDISIFEAMLHRAPSNAEREKA